MHEGESLSGMTVSSLQVKLENIYIQMDAKLKAPNNAYLDDGHNIRKGFPATCWRRCTNVPRRIVG